MKYLKPRIRQPSFHPSDEGNEYESGMPPCPVAPIGCSCDLKYVILHGNDHLACDRQLVQQFNRQFSGAGTHQYPRGRERVLVDRTPHLPGRRTHSQYRVGGNCPGPTSLTAERVDGIDDALRADDVREQSGGHIPTGPDVQNLVPPGIASSQESMSFTVVGSTHRLAEADGHGLNVPSSKVHSGYKIGVPLSGMLPSTRSIHLILASRWFPDFEIHPMRPTPFPKCRSTHDGCETGQCRVSDGPRPGHDGVAVCFAS